MPKKLSPVSKKPVVKESPVVATSPRQASSQLVSQNSLRYISLALARFCLRHAISFQQIADQLKLAFIDAAKESIKLAGEEPTASKLSVMTGLQRRDVGALEKNLPEENTATTSILMRVVGHWQQEKKYRSRTTGEPRLLSYEGRESEFANLVRSVNKDVNPYAVLFELERVNAVTKVGDHLKLRTELYRPTGNTDEGLKLLGGDLVDFVDAVDQNIYGNPTTPNLHIKTSYDNIVQSAAPIIRKWFIDRGEEFHRAARDFLARFDKDINPELGSEDAGVRVVVGQFSLVKNEKTPVDPEDCSGGSTK